MRMERPQETMDRLKEYDHIAKYEAYQNQIKETEKKTLVHNLILTATVIVITGLVIIKEGQDAAWVVIPLAVIAGIIAILWYAGSNKNVDQNWNESAVAILMETMRRSFSDVKYSEEGNKEKVLVNVFKKGDLFKKTNEIKASWKGRAFTAYNACIEKSDPDGYSETLFIGLIVEMNMDVKQDYWWSAGLEGNQYNVYCPKNQLYQYASHEMLKEKTQKVFNADWMKKLSNRNKKYVYACISGEKDKQKIEIGLQYEYLLFRPEKKEAYYDYVARLEDSMVRLKELLDQILTNDQIFC